MSFKQGKLRDFGKSQCGAVLLETMIAIPILVFIVFIIIYLSFQFFAAATTERATRLAARELSMGRADDETNGVLTPCSGLTGSTPSGAPSAEVAACNYVSNLPGDFFVTARDGSNSGFGDEGNDAIVYLEVPRSSLLSIAYLQGITPGAKLTSQTIMRMQNTGGG